MILDNKKIEEMKSEIRLIVEKWAKDLDELSKIRLTNTISDIIISKHS